MFILDILIGIMFIEFFFLLKSGSQIHCSTIYRFSIIISKLMSVIKGRKN